MGSQSRTGLSNFHFHLAYSSQSEILKIGEHVFLTSYFSNIKGLRLLQERILSNSYLLTIIMHS